MVSPPNQSLVSVGIELCRREIVAVALDAADTVMTAAVRPAAAPDDTVAELVSLIEDLKGEFGPLGSIGIAVPGLVDRGSQRVALSAISPRHSELDLRSDLAFATGLNVTMENDANAAAYGEYELGAGRGSENMFYATLGEGVGGAFIFGGKIWHGTSGFAGEFGYVPINSDGTRLEQVAAEANIIRRTRERFRQDNTSSLNNLTEDQITLNAIVEAARADDDFAQLMLSRTGKHVGTAIASVINLLNIEKIVVGGEIMVAKHLVLDAIVARAKQLSFSPSFNTTSIIEGTLGKNAAAVGAALLSRRADH